MPLYTYEHPETQERKDILQSMNDVHEYYEEGVKWNRVFYSGGTTTPVNPDSVSSFIEKTSKPDTYGALIDRSTELSEKRAAKNGGTDKLREQAIKEYSKARNGRPYYSRLEA